MQIWFDIVPDGTYSEASLPRTAATRSCRRLTLGSSPKTSSPTSAAAMAARMPALGRVTVSLRKSTMAVMVRSVVVYVERSRGAVRALSRKRLFLLVLQEPAFADLLEEDLARGNRVR